MTVEQRTKLYGAPLLSEVLRVSLDSPAGKSLDVDLDAYKAYLDDPALSDAQKDQIVDALWKIIVCFVDLGFGMSPLQQACGKLEETGDEGGIRSQHVLGFKHGELSEYFNELASEKARSTSEEEQ